MNYASSRDAIKRKLSGKSIFFSSPLSLFYVEQQTLENDKILFSTGIKHSLQLNDYTDCSGRNSFAGNLGKTVISVEGTEVSVEN